MRYFIGYLIQGEAGEWHRTLAQEISEKFHTWQIREHVPPHITIFRPFDADDVFSVKSLLCEWTAERSVPGNFVLSGFGHFDDTVVFANVVAEKSVTDAVSDLQKQLQALSGMPVPEYTEWHPHATLANHAGASEISAIRQYVSTLPKPHFVLPFDNVTLFRYDEGKEWRVDEFFYLNT